MFWDALAQGGFRVHPRFRICRDPLRQVKGGRQITLQISAVYRLMVSCAITGEREALHPPGDLSLPLPEILGAVLEGPVCRWNPERGQVSGLDEEAPEAETELGNHFAVDLSVFAGSSQLRV